MIASTCIPSYIGGLVRRIVSQSGLRKKVRPYLKMTKGKRYGGVAQVIQVIQCLSSKLNALYLNPNATKKKKTHLWNFDFQCDSVEWWWDI